MFFFSALCPRQHLRDATLEEWLCVGGESLSLHVQQAAARATAEENRTAPASLNLLPESPVY